MLCLLCLVVWVGCLLVLGSDLDVVWLFACGLWGFVLLVSWGLIAAGAYIGVCYSAEGWCLILFVACVLICCVLG